MSSQWCVQRKKGGKAYSGKNGKLRRREYFCWLLFADTLHLFRFIQERREISLVVGVIPPVRCCAVVVKKGVLKYTEKRERCWVKRKNYLWVKHSWESMDRACGAVKGGHTHDAITGIHGNAGMSQTPYPR